MSSLLYMDKPRDLPQSFPAFSGDRLQRFWEISGEYTKALEDINIPDLLRKSRLDKKAIRAFLKSMIWEDAMSLSHPIISALMDVNMRVGITSALLPWIYRERVRHRYREAGMPLIKGMLRVVQPKSVHETLHASLLMKVFLTKLAGYFREWSNIVSPVERSFVSLRCFIEAYRGYIGILEQEVHLQYALPIDWGVSFWDMMNTDHPIITLNRCATCWELSIGDIQGKGVKFVCDLCNPNKGTGRFSINTTPVGFTSLSDISFIKKRRGCPQGGTETFQRIKHVREMFDWLGIE